MKDRHAHDDAVGHLLEDDRLRRVSQFGVDLDAAVDGTRVHDDRARLEPGRNDGRKKLREDICIICNVKANFEN